MRWLAIVAGAMLAFGAVGHAQPIAKLDPPGVAKPAGAYSHLAVVPPGTKLLYVAGQIGVRLDGSLAAGIEDQLIQARENLRAILAAQGAGPEHIVKVTIYAAARPSDMKRIREHRAAFYRGTAFPPSTWAYVDGLIRPEYLVEVEAVAAVPAK